MYRRIGIHTDLLWGVTPRRWQPIDRSHFRHMSTIHIICFVIQYQIEQGIWIDKLRVPPLSINALGSWYGTHDLVFSSVYQCENRLSFFHVNCKFLGMTNKLQILLRISFCLLAMRSSGSLLSKYVLVVNQIAMLKITKHLSKLCLISFTSTMRVHFKALLIVKWISFLKIDADGH